MNTKYSGHEHKVPQKKPQSIKKHSAKKRHKNLSPLKAFLITLAIVIGVGMTVIVAITLPKYIRLHKNEEISFISFVEAIPETLVSDENEIVEEVDNSKYGKVIVDAEYLKQNNIFVKEGNEEDVISLAFCGDILFDDDYAVMAALKQRGGELSASISQETLDVMNGVDVMVVNNEFPYTQKGARQPEKQFTFHADYDTANYLNDMGADVAILANNHVYDYGEEGLLDTLDTVESVGVIPVGAGRNLAEAVTPVYYIINDIKIAIIAATDIERLDNPDTKWATDSSAGVFRSWNSDKIFDAVATAKQNSDFVIVCVHWGTEKEETPDYWQTLLAPKIAEAGADLIIGDHPHRLQGVYYYGNTPCIYSLGNFWFNGFSLDTGLVEVRIDKQGLQSFRFMPAVQSSYSTKLVFDSERDRILNYMRSLSPEADISEEGYISKK